MFLDVLADYVERSVGIRSDGTFLDVRVDFVLQEHFGHSLSCELLLLVVTRSTVLFASTAAAAASACSHYTFAARSRNVRIPKVAVQAVHARVQTACFAESLARSDLALRLRPRGCSAAGITAALDLGARLFFGAVGEVPRRALLEHRLASKLRGQGVALPEKCC